MTRAAITALYRQRVREPGRRITLDDGSQITVTRAHRVHGVDDWTANVQVGDFVCVPGRIDWMGERLPHDLVELVAWQIAEGYEVGYRPGSGAHARGSDSARITQLDERVLERLKSRASQLGAREGITFGTMPISRHPGRASTLCLNSCAWRRFLEREPSYRWGARSADKEIPPRVMSADDGAVAVFLRAFFDAEGSVPASRPGVIEITSASRTLMGQLQILLRRFGIWLRIKSRRKAASNGSGVVRTYWTGDIGGPSLRRYGHLIGFASTRKRERLDNACEAPVNANVEVVPVADVLADLRAAGMPGKWLLPAGFESYGGTSMSPSRTIRACASIRAAHARAASRTPGRSLSAAAIAAARTVEPETLEQAADRLQRRAEREVFYARLTGVEEVALDEWVYDLSVEEHRNYVAGGMLAHNTISSGRALAHRATSTRRFRGLVVAEGRLLGQWRDELAHGAPGRALPPLAPNLNVLVLSEHRQVAGQIRAFDRQLGDRPGVVLAPNGILDRYPADLQVIPWHVLIADEALRYANPATEAHQALAQVRLACVADCWLLTATPRGKSAEHLDVLVGLAVGDRAMIRERLNTREAGDLMDEIHAHRLRVNYGPHLVRVTRQDMQAWMPQVRPAEPLALEPDPALAELLEAIRQGGREAYRRLLAVLRELKTLEPGGELFKRALAELARVQGWCSATSASTSTPAWTPRR